MKTIKRNESFTYKNRSWLVRCALEDLKKNMPNEAVYNSRVKEMTDKVKPAFKDHEKRMKSELKKVINLLRQGYNIHDGNEVNDAIERLVQTIRSCANGFIVGTVMLHVIEGKKYKGIKENN